MAIYNRYGSVITIIGKGEQVQKKTRYDPEPFPVTPVRIQYSDGDQTMRLLESLRADEGWPELKAAADAAPLVKFTRREIQDALMS